MLTPGTPSSTAHVLHHARVGAREHPSGGTFLLPLLPPKPNLSNHGDSGLKATRHTFAPSFLVSAQPLQRPQKRGKHCVSKCPAWAKLHARLPKTQKFLCVISLETHGNILALIQRHQSHSRANLNGPPLRISLPLIHTTGLHRIIYENRSKTSSSLVI